MTGDSKSKHPIKLNKANMRRKIDSYVSEDDNSFGDIRRSSTVLIARTPRPTESPKSADSSGLPEEFVRRTIPWVDVASFFALGMSGWWVYNALYVETPIFVQCANVTDSAAKQIHNGYPTQNHTLLCELPEGASITSELTVVSQLGNVFPFLYRLISRFLGARRVRLPAVIGIWLAIGCASAAVAAFGWQTHVQITDSLNSSVVLLGATFLTGGLGCMSSILYWQFAADFPVSHTKALSLGMAMGGLFPATIALVQNFVDLSSSTSFTPKTQMLIAAAVQALFIFFFSRTAYLYYHLQKAIESEAKSSEPKLKKTKGPTPSTESANELVSPLLDSAVGSEEPIATSTSESSPTGTEDPLDEQTTDADGDEISEAASSDIQLGTCFQRLLVHPLLPFSVIFILYSATYSLPSFVPFFVRAYSNSLRKQLYTFVNFAYALGDVLGRLIATSCCWIPSWSILLLFSLFVLTIYAFEVFAALANVVVDCDLLPGFAGYTFIGLHFLYFAFRGFIVTNLYVRVKSDYPKHRRGTVTGRMSTVGQVGSLVGTLLAFLVITLPEKMGHPLFHANVACP